jgi:DNA helicase-2/ATP-dependent DNA helicase PcrA
MMDIAHDLLDDHVDDEIAACLDLTAPRSFFLFAGAGSGKTRSLVNAILHLRKKHSQELRLRGQRIAVITYTNAACDEIIRRTQFDPLVVVKTIHSFAWTLLEGLTRDIREWLRIQLALDIKELEALEARGRKGTKASATRIADIASKTKRINRLSSVKKFVYSPTGDNRSRDSLSHSEVIKIVSDFILTKPAMQQIVVTSYPVLLIDESQDTNKHLIEALFALQIGHEQKFSLGLFGDTMQRIYNDGKDGLGTGLPPTWATPAKRLNHRCAKRIVKLVNRIRAGGPDRQVQEPRSDAIEGHARIFVIDAGTPDKRAVEHFAAQYMAALTGEQEWVGVDGYKCLILEHRMAAVRMGFSDMFIPLHEIDEFRTGLLNGTLPATRFFASDVLPLVEQHDDKFAVARILRKSSPLLSDEKTRASTDPEALLRELRDAVKSLMELWSDGKQPTFGLVLRNIARSGLFVIPDALRAYAFRDETQITEPDDPDEVDNERLTARAAAIDDFLETPFGQIEHYARYVGGSARLDTHQGVKGREFPRVMVIMDDTEARGFLFKYDKLFGGGGSGDSVTASTRRLFYVTCSRAERGLALIAYSTDPEQVKQYVLNEQWFTDDEIVTADGLAVHSLGADNAIA